MQNIFKVEGLFYRYGMKLWSLLLLNALILITSLPLVTIGAVQSATFTVTKKMILQDETKIISCYWRSFKENFVVSTRLWFGVLGFGYLLWLNSQVVLQMPIFYQIGWLILALIGLNFLQYAFYYQSSFIDRPIRVFFNTIKLGLKRPFTSLGLILFLISPYLLGLLSSQLLVFGLYFQLFLGLSFHFYLRTYLLLIVFQSFEKGA